LIAITVTLATFMELLDTAIANVSLPHIAGGLATSYDESTWVLTSYLVANAIVLPLSAWLRPGFWAQEASNGKRGQGPRNDPSITE
jgi:MFS family permease